MISRSTWLGLSTAVALAACGSSQRPGTSGSGGAATAPKEQVVAVDWVLEAGAKDTTRVSLSLTDETGAKTIELLGDFAGTCTEIQAERAVVALRCEHPTDGAELRIRRYGGDLILLRARADDAQDEMAYEEKKRITIPAGATVRAKE